jgi:FHA domain
MEQLTTRIGIEPGPGLIGRFGDTVIVIPRGEASGAGTIQELLGLAAQVGSDRQAPANAIASRLAGWVISHMAGDAPAFGIVAPMRDGVVMFLRGAVWCTITEGGSTREVSGEQALTWVDQIVPGTFERLAIGAAADRPVRADPLSDLRSGVVPGQGFVLSRTAGIPGAEPADAVIAPEAEPAAAAAAGAGGAAASAGSGGFAWSPSEEAPGPPTDRPQEAWALRAEPQDHQPEPPDYQPEPSDYQAEPPDYQAEPSGYEPEPSGYEPEPPDRQPEPADYQAEPPGRQPGVPGHQPTMVVRTGDHELAPSQAEPGPAPGVQPTTVGPVPPRPTTMQPTAMPSPAGVLTAPEGPRIVLEGVLVLGREPRQDPAVESGEASPVQLQDPDHVISRVHAYVSVENGIVLVRDADSMHGTYFSPPGGEEWTRIGTEPSPLPPGWNLQIGPLIFTYESARPGGDR